MTTWGVRVCPHSDAECKHGVSCPYTCATDAYDGIKALLPPAPDGATEGSWRLVPVEPTREMIEAGSVADVPWEFVDTATGERVTGPFTFDLRGSNKIERAEQIAAAVYHAMLAASPSVSQKEGLGSYRASEEAAPSGATASWRDLESAPRDGTPVVVGGNLDDAEPFYAIAQWDDADMDTVRSGWMSWWFTKDGQPVYADWATHWFPLPNPPGAGVSSWRHGKPPSGAPSEQNPSSQPTQTGEENAGLVEDAYKRLVLLEDTRTDPSMRSVAPLVRRLLDALLASRSPIPGEGN